MRPVYLLLGLSFIALLMVGCSSSEQPVPSAPIHDLEATVQAIVQKELPKIVLTPTPVSLSGCTSAVQCTDIGDNYGDHEINKALPYYTDAIRLNPNYARAYFKRGYAYGKLGQNEKAIEDYTEVIRLDPKSATTYYNRGLNYARHLGQYERGIEDFTEAIRLDPNNSTYYNNRGLSYYHLDQPERAIEDYTEAIRLDPKYVSPYYNRGLVYGKLDQYERALEDFNEAIRLDPDSEELREMRSLVLEILGR
jgi:tetratricopeptide (TPR) repeat protein